MLAAPSPWWYQRRFWVFGAIYAAGFGLARLAWEPPVPSFLWLGSRLGAAWPQRLLYVVALFAVAAWLLRVWGASYLGAAVVWNPDALDDRLIVDGPFRYLRNPLYLGVILLAIALGGLATPFGAAIIIAGNVLFCLALISVETPVLRARYGPVFDAYRRAVPSLVPRVSPADVPGTVRARPALREGLLSEIFLGCVALGTLAVCVAGRDGVGAFYLLVAAGFAYRVLARRGVT